MAAILCRLETARHGLPIEQLRRRCAALQADPRQKSLPALNPSLRGATDRCAQTHAVRSSEQSSDSNGVQRDPAEIESTARALIQEDPETKRAIDRITAAQQRVFELQAAQSEIAAQIEAANSTSAASDSNARQNAIAAADDVATAARDFGNARSALEEAEDERARLRSSLQKEEDRVQSVLAGAVAATGGTLVHLPLLLASQHPDVAKFVSLGTVAVSSALFGIVWRYAVRSEQDAANSQLKAGCVAAFGLTSGLGQASVLIGTALDQGGAQLSGELLAQAAVVTGASMLQFTAASILLEAAIARGIVSRSAPS